MRRLQIKFALNDCWQTAQERWFMICNREKTEWVNYMWHNADDNGAKRILLIGDSVTDGIYNDVSELLEQYAVTDLFASSRIVTDPVFDAELEAALVDYTHEIIYFNNGLHGIDVAIEQFEEAFFDKVEFLLHYSKKMVLATCTPITEKGKPQILSPKNDIVLKRNEVIRKAAKKYSLVLNDWYEFVLSCPFYKKDDGYHYTEEGKHVQAKLVCNILAKLI